MAVWTIKSVSGDSPGAAALRGCKILTAPPGSPAGIAYLLFTANGDAPIARSPSNPPNFTGFALGGLNWNVSSTTTAPQNPPNGSTLSGTYWNNAVGARPGSEDGTWQAEATGGGPVEDDDDSEKSEEDKSDEDDAQSFAPDSPDV